MDIFETLEKNYIKYGKVKIHVIIDNNEEIWFNANNTANALDYSDYRGAIKKHVNVKDTIQMQYINNKNKKGQPQSLYLNEAGLYSLILRSKMPKAIQFTEWITHEVLPSIRKYGSYKLKQEYNNKLNEIMEKINYLEKENIKIKKENTIIKNDLKKEIFPQGGIVYAIDYSTDEIEIYRIGMTHNMNLRKKIYDTHTLHKQNVVIIKESTCPIKLEACMKALLYDYRYKDRKDFYICNLDKIKSAFRTCITCINKSGSKTNKNDQTGGGNLFNKKLKMLKNKKNLLQRKINRLSKKQCTL